MGFLKRLLHIPTNLILPIIVFGGIIAGLGSYTIYMSKATCICRTTLLPASIATL
jgi:hypothetical protein